MGLFKKSASNPAARFAIGEVQNVRNFLTKLKHQAWSYIDARELYRVYISRGGMIQIDYNRFLDLIKHVKQTHVFVGSYQTTVLLDCVLGDLAISCTTFADIPMQPIDPPPLSPAPSMALPEMPPQVDNWAA